MTETVKERQPGKFQHTRMYVATSYIILHPHLFSSTSWCEAVFQNHNHR